MLMIVLDQSTPGKAGVPASAGPRARDRDAIAAIALPTALAFGLGLWNAWRPSMYSTEAVTYWAAHLPVPSLLHVLSHVDAVHGTYYALMHVVFLFGNGTLALRLPSVIGLSAAVAGTGLLARRLTGSNRVAFFAAAALAVAPVAGSYAQAGRSYAIDIAAAVVTWLLLLRAVDGVPLRRLKPWHAYTVAIVVTAYLHEMTLLMLAAHLATLVWAGVGRETIRAWVRASLWALLGCTLLLVASIVQSRQVSWILPATWASARALYQNLFGPGHVALIVNAVLVAVAVLTGARRRGRTITGERIDLVQLALPLLVLPPALLIGESAVTTPLYGGTRYLIWCAPALALLVGQGLETLLATLTRHRLAFAGAVAGAVLFAGLLQSQWTLVREEHSAAGMPQNMLAVADYLQVHAHAGDGVIYAPRSFESVDLAYPSKIAVLDDLVLGHSGRWSGTLYGTEKSPAAITASVDGARRIWLVGTGTVTHSPRPELEALRRHFHAVSHQHVTGCEITLYVRDAAV